MSLIAFLYHYRSWIQRARFREHPFRFGKTFQSIVSKAEIEREIFVAGGERPAPPKSLKRGLIKRFSRQRIMHPVALGKTSAPEITIQIRILLLVREPAQRIE